MNQVNELESAILARAQTLAAEYRTRAERSRDNILREAADRRLVEASLASKKDLVESSDIRALLTSRGFARNDFTDLYGESCSIQESSLATRAAIWLGADSPAVKAFMPEGSEFSAQLEFDNGHSSGWATVKLNVEGHEYGNVLQTGRMHLSIEHVQELLPLLQHFVETGYLPSEDS